MAPVPIALYGQNEQMDLILSVFVATDAMRRTVKVGDSGTVALASQTRKTPI